MKSLKQKKAFITGAASGIGRATAIAMAREGSELFLTDINAKALEAVVAEIVNAGGKVSVSRALDIASYEAVRDYARDIHREHGSMDLVLNIAGIAIWGAVENMEHRQWRQVIDVNLMGPIHVMECFVPEMVRAGRGGHLVNVSSAAGLFGLPWHAAYSGSKFGLRGVSEVLRFDLRRHNIDVSLVCPGGVDTGLVQTIQIAGIDTGAPFMSKLRAAFQAHAISPEKAAKAILSGIRARRYLVFTSMDIRIGYFFQGKFPITYDIVMRIMNHVMYKVMQRQERRAEAEREATR
ncbi:SDR family oxidoreductase [Solimonas sp. K1W22B-7]|uniref:SDR family oxidoreductase n=1 Tax=Solimonas sp. K1W22B-7 TaxID=2303331 RepID=UPI001969038E|nr:SDR family oxidoreductase [Solimonas sp. K1W22B-7]